MAENIGYFKLLNGAGFDCAPYVKWSKGQAYGTTNTGNTTTGGNFTDLSPGDAGVPDGATVQLYIDVYGGSDRSTGTDYTYVAGLPMFAKYDITGSADESNVNFDGVQHQ